MPILDPWQGAVDLRKARPGRGLLVHRDRLPTINKGFAARRWEETLHRSNTNPQNAGTGYETANKQLSLVMNQSNAKWRHVLQTKAPKRS